MSSSLFVNANTALAQTEEFFNFYGKIPVVSLLSGHVRDGLGTVEALAGAAGWAFFKASSYVVQDSQGALTKASRSWEYAVHGVLNMGRGKVEKMFLLGNIATYIYDNICKVRFGYRNEVPQHEFTNIKIPSIIRF